ncbi:MAG: hypothetical protein IT377_00440 [Polyangiaceae bacterium]|nr:hypothetical protein [Polyangiaceae bacterium]
MSDDLLRAATQALRDEHADSDQAARFTRARVMASLHKVERRRSTKLAFLVPVAAVLVGSTAWGAATGRLPTRFSPPPPASLERPAERAAELVKGAPPRARAARAAAQVAETQPAEPPPAEAQPAEAQPAEAVVANARVAPLPAADPSHELYRAAHHAHFTRGDAAGALSAWEAYLAAAPRGRFATEARYNRALCLVRLGRRAEAQAALEPFAAGRFGGYRQREASELTAALGR